MPLPIICTYERLQQYLLCYRDVFSKPQYKYFVIVLLGFIQCQGARTLSGLRHGVAAAGSLSGLSRFLARAPWDAEALAKLWQARFRAQMRPVVQAECSRLKFAHPKHRGRASTTRRDRVSDGRRLDDAESERPHDGRHRQASLDDP